MRLSGSGQLSVVCGDLAPLWVGLLLWAYSPFTLMGQVLSCLRVSKGARLFLMAPFWAPAGLVPPSDSSGVAMPQVAATP